MKVFKLTTGRTALYLALSCLVLPATSLAGGLVDDMQLDKNDRSDEPPASHQNNTPRAQPQKQQEPEQNRLLEKRDHQTRPTFNGSLPLSKTPADHKDHFGQLPTISDTQAASDTLSTPAPLPVKNKVYTPTIAQMIRKDNERGFSTGQIKLFAEHTSWGPGVKIQDCFGDNVLTKFTIADPGNSRGLTFEYQAVPDKKSRANSEKWGKTKPGQILKGRYIHLRSKSESQSDIVQLQVFGTCIDSPR